MAEHPERHGKKILRLSDYMYLKSGYYKRLIDYFVNQAVVNYTVDTRITNPAMMEVKPDKIKKDISNLLLRVKNSILVMKYIIF